MNKATYRFLRILGALMLTLGNFYSVYAAPPSLLETPAINSTGTSILAEVASNAYYVSANNGSDSNPGSTAQPWRTVQHAVNLVNPGDTIYLRTGTYQEQIKINKSGQPGAPITLTVYPGEDATIDGGNGMTIYSQGSVGYWVVEGLTIKSTNTHAIRFGWFHEAVTNHITLRQNYIYGAVFTVGNYQLFEDNEISGIGYSASGGYGGINDSHGGLGDNATHHNIYRNNYIHDFANYNARGIWVQGRTHDNLVEGNTIENIWTNGLGQCIDLDAGSSTLVQWRHTVRGNRVKDCSYVGIQLENVFDSVIENNIVFAEKGGSAGIIDINYSSNIGCGVGGESNQYGDTNGDNSCKGDITNNVIRQNLIYKQGAWGWGYGGLVNWGAGGLKVLGNTIYATASSGNAAINFQSESVNTRKAVIRNNILFNSNGVALCARENVDVFETDDHNMLYTSRGNDVIGTGESCRSSSFSLSAYKSTTGKGQGSMQADPQFVNPIADFRLKSSSPAIDAGVDIGVNKDIDGNARVQGAGFDMGVYENKNGVPSTSTPIMATVTATIEPVVPTATSYRPTATAMETAQEPTQTVDVQPTPTAEMTNVPATETLLPVTLTPTAIIDFPTPTVTEVVIQPTATPTAIINLPFPTATELVVQPTATISSLPASSTPTESSVLASPTPTQATTRKPREETIYDDKDKAFSYSVGWRSVKNKRAYGGSLKVTTRNEASVKLNFTGQSFSVLYKGGKAFGKMDVYVDGKFVGTINQQQKAAFQSRWDYPGQLAFGNHTLKLIFVTNKRAKDRVRGSLDAVIVH